MLSQLPKSKKTWENAVPEANYEKKHLEAKKYRFGRHLGAILASSWGTWEAFGDLLGHLGANLSQHKPILSHLGASSRPP